MGGEATQQTVHTNARDRRDRRDASQVLVARTDVLVIGGGVAALGGIAIELAFHGGDVARWGLASAIALLCVSALAAVAVWTRWRAGHRPTVALIACAASAWTVGEAVEIVTRHVLHRHGFPGIAHTIEHVFATEDHVAVRFVLHGSHTGSFFGIPATGRPVAIAANVLMQVAGGKVTTLWGMFDEAGLLRQIGVLPG